MTRRSEGFCRGVTVDEWGRLRVDFDELAAGAGVAPTKRNCEILWKAVMDGLQQNGFDVANPEIPWVLLGE